MVSTVNQSQNCQKNLNGYLFFLIEVAVSQNGPSFLTTVVGLLETDYE